MTTQVLKSTLIQTKPFQGLRKVYHVWASSLFPLAYLYLPFHWNQDQCRQMLLVVTGSCFLVSFLLDVLRLKNKDFNSKFMRLFAFLIRRTEENKFNGSTFLCLAFFGVIFFFSPKVAIAAMLFLSLGDAAAELGGKYFGRIRIWGKSAEGTFAFFLVAFLIAYALFENWPLAFLGALAGALVELCSFELDDNLTVPLGSALVLSLALFFFHLT